MAEYPAGGTALSRRLARQGHEAASYVDYLVGAMKPPEDEVDFTLDRPFFFMITGEDGVPYFAGVMNDP